MAEQQLAEAILSHALEIICLLTVEDYFVVKRPNGTRCTFSICAADTESNICDAASRYPELIFTLLGMGDKTQKKIAELASKIVRLLTKEVPLKCEDVAVYFSKDEWEYVEGHGAQYKNNQGTHNIEKPTVTVQQGTEKSYPIIYYIKEQSDVEPHHVTGGTSDLSSSEFFPGNPEQKLPTVEVHIPLTDDQTAPEISILSSCEIKSEPDDGDSSDDTLDSADSESPQFPYSPDQDNNCNITENKEEPEESQDSNLSASGDTTSPDCTYKDMDDLQQKANRKRARTHKSTSEKKSLPCEVCGKVLGRKATLEKHLQIHTGERPFLCNDCGQRFSCKSHLTAHERSHSGERPYVCIECGRRFFKQQHLVLHQVVHTGEKPFSCSVCGKGFTRQSSVIKHSAMHAEQKPFVCDQCGKSYCQYASLVVHQRQHSGEKPFVCKYCEKGFTCKDTMLKHQRAHTGEKPFVCPQCPKSFIDKSSMSKHKRKVHAKEPKPA